MQMKISIPKYSSKRVLGLFLVISLLSPFSTMAQSLKWKFQTGAAVFSSPAIGSDGTVYVGSDDDYLYALNAADGAQKWKFQIGTFFSSPAIGSDGTIYVGSKDNYLYAINPDGSLKWKFQTGRDGVRSSPAIGSDGTIYVGSDDTYLYALYPDGPQKWKFQTGGYVPSSPAIGSDGTIYVGSYDTYLYALNPDGTQKWKFQTGAGVFSSPAIGSDGTIYVGSDDTYLYAINSDGTQKWKFQTGAAVFSSSPAIGSDGTVYVGSKDNYFYAINPNGTQKWKFKTGHVVYSSPAIGSDGTVYVGSGDDYLYALNSNSMGLADIYWPKFHHDNQNTGRVDGAITIISPVDGDEFPVGAVVDVVAEVRDEFREPMEGVEVTFTATGGTVEPTVAITDDNGQAMTQLTVAEGKNIVTATITENPDIFDTVTVKSIGWIDPIHVPDDYPTIQAGIDAAVDGFTVLVADGTYKGEGNVNLDFKGKAITVKSVNGAEVTIIDCEGAENTRGFYFHREEASSTVLDGFTITNGRMGGIYCYYSSPSIINCTIIENTALGGGGISCWASSPTITNCSITKNTASSGLGGGISCGRSSPTITNCTIIENTALGGGGIYCESESSLNIINCIIAGNTANESAGGISCNGSSPSIVNCTITGNTANNGGGISCDYFSSPSIKNTILWGDTATDGGNEVYLFGTSSITITFSDVQGGQAGIAGNGTVISYENNIDVYPLFVDAINKDYHLAVGSPCLGAGTSDGAPATDIEGNPRGTPPAIGAYEVPLIPPFRPAIVVSPFPIAFGDVIVGVATPVSVSIDNIGTADLTVTDITSDLGGILTISETTFTVVPGIVHEITLTLTPSTAGEINGTLTITSNDPNSPTEIDISANVLKLVIRVPQDQPSIQAGIDVAIDGVTVLVDDGTYTGADNVNIDFKGKAITVKSVNGAAVTIIDCENVDDTRGFIFQSRETSSSVLDGFTITNGRMGGIACTSSPTITNCIITGNAAFNGGGIACQQSSESHVPSPIITNCTITGNTADVGGGIHCASASPRITNCIIAGNLASSAGGGIHCSQSSLAFSISAPNIINCTITGNTTDKGGGIYTTRSVPSIKNTILWGDTATDSGSEVYLVASDLIGIPSHITITFSDVEGGQEAFGGDAIDHSTYENNIEFDPLFVDPENGDYHLQAVSPCINAGTHEGAPDDDIEGKPRDGFPDIGAYEGAMTEEPNIWVSTDTLSFSAPLEQSREKSLIIKNFGILDLEVTNITSDNDTFTVSPSSFTLASLEHQEVVVTFTPTVVGIENGTLTIESNDPDEPMKEIALSGEGRQPSGPNISVLSLDGDGDWVEIPNSPELNPQQITIETWVKFNLIIEHDGSQDILNKASDRDTGAYYLRQCNGGFGFYIGVYHEGNHVDTDPDFSPEINHWYHVVGAYDGTIMRLFIDGQLMGSKEVGSLTVGNSSPLVIGRELLDNWPYFVNGQIDEVRIWNVARTQEEIQATMARPLTGDESGLVGYWQFDVLEDLGVGSDGADDVRDLSGNGNHGDLVGDAQLVPADDLPLSVELAFLTASASADSVTLHWRTISEINNLGFNIYRSDTKDGKYTKVNARLIQGVGTDATPYDYSFTDENVELGQVYYYYIEDVDFTGKPNKSHIIEVTVGKQSIKEVTVGKQSIKTHLVPPTFALLQNYPNPFNPETWIPYQLAEDADVSINIYSVSGKLVKTLHLGQKRAGFYMKKSKSAYWDGTDSFGEKVASGVYFYTLQAGEFRATQKMVIIK